MRAARIHEFGANVKIDNIKVPKCPENFVKIKIFATSINHLDLWVKNGIPDIKINLPFILGSDAAAHTVVDLLKVAELLEYKASLKVSPDDEVKSCVAVKI